MHFLGLWHKHPVESLLSSRICRKINGPRRRKGKWHLKNHATLNLDDKSRKKPFLKSIDAMHQKDSLTMYCVGGYNEKLCKVMLGSLEITTCSIKSSYLEGATPIRLGPRPRNRERTPSFSRMILFRKEWMSTLLSVLFFRVEESWKFGRTSAELPMQHRSVLPHCSP